MLAEDLLSTNHSLIAIHLWTGEISQDIERVALPNDSVDVSNEVLVHLFGRLEGSIAMLNDVCMPKV